MSEAELERSTMRAVAWRLVPFIGLLYLLNILDRANVGFARLRMQDDLHLSKDAFDLGYGMFYVGYLLFEVPSNLLMRRVGPRRWIARIMISWGFVSAATMFARDQWSFYALRILLGIAEAGFFPGIIFYLTLWFPAVYRARIVGYFMAAIPLSTVIGAPVSGLLLSLDGFLGLKGWQWLFVLEAAPALILSGVVFFYLTDRPADATWLEPDERAWLVARLEDERLQRETVRRYSVREALLNPKVLALSLVYFGAVATNYGLSFFLPQIVKAFGISDFQAGLVSALPYVVGLISIVFWGRRSDRKLERRFHLAFPLFVASAGIGISTALDDPTMKMAALSVAGFGIFGCLPVFWTFPAAFLSGAAAAGGIALINSIGNLAGFAGPYAMGRIKDLTGSYTGGLLSLSAVGLIAMVIVLALHSDHSH